MRYPTLVALAGVCACWNPSACAAVINASRTTLYNITFANNTFIGADARYDAIVGISGNPGDSEVVNPFNILRTAFTNFSWTGSGGTSVSNVMMLPGPTASATITTTGAPGSYDAGYDTPIATNTSASWIVSGSSGGLNTLTLVNGGGAGLVDPGFPFILDVFLPGNWSATGTGTGQHTFAGIDPAWTVDKNFVFNGSTTEFHAFNNQYAGNPSGPNLNFTLYGSPTPIPEPDSLALLSSGLGTLLVFWRRSKRPASARALPPIK